MLTERENAIISQKGLIMNCDFVRVHDNSEILEAASGPEFLFDWKSKTVPDSIKIALVGDKIELIGMVEFAREQVNKVNHLYLIEVSTEFRGSAAAGKLFAYVAKDSLEQGFDGFVIFEAKTVLIEYYILKYGAKKITSDGRRLYFDTEASKLLVEKYLEGGDCYGGN